MSEELNILCLKFHPKICFCDEKILVLHYLRTRVYKFYNHIVAINIGKDEKGYGPYSSQNNQTPLPFPQKGMTKGFGALQPDTTSYRFT